MRGCAGTTINSSSTGKRSDPRFAISRYFRSSDLIAHFSYDRVFQTPSFENILLSNSFEVQSINPDFLRLPVEPSEGNYYEAGLSKSFANNLRVDVNYYLRNVNNYADDDQIENTTISFPIAFRKAIIYGAEGKITVPNWHKISGFASYSYMVGNVWFPVTGGLFLGDDVQDAETQISGHFPDSQDQRNTVFTRWVYQIKPRFWVAGGIQYGTGLPFEFEGSEHRRWRNMASKLSTGSILRAAASILRYWSAPRLGRTYTSPTV